MSIYDYLKILSKPLAAYHDHSFIFSFFPRTGGVKSRPILTFQSSLKHATTVQCKFFLFIYIFFYQTREFWTYIIRIDTLDEFYGKIWIHLQEEIYPLLFYKKRARSNCTVGPLHLCTRRGVTWLNGSSSTPPPFFKKCEKRASSRISAYCRYHWRDTRIFKTVLLFQVFSHFELCAPFPTLAEFLIKSPCPELYSIIMASHSLHKHRETESGARLRRKKEAY